MVDRVLDVATQVEPGGEVGVCGCGCVCVSVCVCVCVCVMSIAILGWGNV